MTEHIKQQYHAIWIKKPAPNTLYDQHTHPFPEAESGSVATNFVPLPAIIVALGLAMSGIVSVGVEGISAPVRR